jgi:hypothetical protein
MFSAMDDSPISPELAGRVANELAPEEKLVWAGQPRADLALRAAWVLIPMGILFTGFTLFWTALAPWFMAPCGLPFFAIGLFMLGSPIWLRTLARKTVYALTDRRAIIFKPSWFGRVLVQSFTAAGLGQMSRRERPDGSGDLIFQVFTTGFGENARSEQQGFLAIDDVRAVEDLVRRTLSVGA